MQGDEPVERGGQLGGVGDPAHGPAVGADLPREPVPGAPQRLLEVPAAGVDVLDALEAQHRRGPGAPLQEGEGPVGQPLRLEPRDVLAERELRHVPARRVGAEVADDGARDVAGARRVGQQGGLLERPDPQAAGADGLHERRQTAQHGAAVERGDADEAVAVADLQHEGFVAGVAGEVVQPGERPVGSGEGVGLAGGVVQRLPVVGELLHRGELPVLGDVQVHAALVPSVSGGLLRCCGVRTGEVDDPVRPRRAGRGTNHLLGAPGFPTNG